MQRKLDEVSQLQSYLKQGDKTIETLTQEIQKLKEVLTSSFYCAHITPSYILMQSQIVIFSIFTIHLSHTSLQSSLQSLLSLEQLQEQSSSYQEDLAALRSQLTVSQLEADKFTQQAQQQQQELQAGKCSNEAYGAERLGILSYCSYNITLFIYFMYVIVTADKNALESKMSKFLDDIASLESQVTSLTEQLEQSNIAIKNSDVTVQQLTQQMAQQLTGHSSQIQKVTLQMEELTQEKDQKIQQLSADLRDALHEVCSQIESLAFSIQENSLSFRCLIVFFSYT